jgi:hypothetical protein
VSVNDLIKLLAENQGLVSKSYHMTELDQVWARMLAGAEANATQLGRDDIVAYLCLRATNDAIRAAGVKWLFDTMIEIVGDAQRRHTTLTIDREEPHKFARGNARMVGSKLTVRHGVRCLTVEAGWTRAPDDGVMRGAALAFARISHFGLPRHDAEMKLVHDKGLPRWCSETGEEIDSGDLQGHVDVFLGL